MRWNVARGGVALGVAVGIFAIGLIDPFVGVAGASVCGQPGPGKIAVALVVDNANATPALDCVVVPEGSTGLDVLAKTGHTARFDPDSPGFVCAIDGFPATGCGESTDRGISYWSYWSANQGRWLYSSVGAHVQYDLEPEGGRVVGGCAVDGWRWVVAKTTTEIPDERPRAQLSDSSCGPVTVEAPGNPSVVPVAPAPAGGSASPGREPTAAVPSEDVAVQGETVDRGEGGSTSADPATDEIAPVPSTVAGEVPSTSTSSVPGGSQGPSERDREGAQRNVTGAPANSDTVTLASSSSAGDSDASSGGSLWLTLGSIAVVGGLGTMAAARFRRSAS